MDKEYLDKRRASTSSSAADVPRNVGQGFVKAMEGVGGGVARGVGGAAAPDAAPARRLCPSVPSRRPTIPADLAPSPPRRLLLEAAQGCRDGRRRGLLQRPRARRSRPRHQAARRAGRWGLRRRGGHQEHHRRLDAPGGPAPPPRASRHAPRASRRSPCRASTHAPFRPPLQCPAHPLPSSPWGRRSSHSGSGCRAPSARAASWWPSPNRTPRRAATHAPTTRLRLVPIVAQPRRESNRRPGPRPAARVGC